MTPDVSGREHRKIPTVTVGDSDIYLNGQLIEFVDLNMLAIDYYPVFKHMSKNGKRQHRRASAVNRVKRRRKMRSRRRGLSKKIQIAVYNCLIEHQPVRNTAETRERILRAIADVVPEIRPTITINAEVAL